MIPTVNGEESATFKLCVIRSSVRAAAQDPRLAARGWLVVGRGFGLSSRRQRVEGVTFGQKAMSRLHLRLAIGSAGITLATMMFVAAVTLDCRPTAIAAPRLASAHSLKSTSPATSSPSSSSTAPSATGPTKARARLRLHSPGLILKGGLSGAPIDAGQERTEPPHPARARPRRRGSDAARRGSAARRVDRAPARVDRPGRADARATTDSGARRWPPRRQGRRSEHWAYIKPVRPAPPAVANARLAAQRHRSLRAGAARAGKARAVAGSAESDAAPARHASTSPGCRRRPPSSTRSSPTPAPDAYERVVDRLLASPHYGERWARPWLDLARYADTNGYEKDNRRSIWKYRDWVIDALNRDMPFDQFTIEQIAGDMLPNATHRAEDRHRLPSQRDDQRGRRRRSRRVDVRGPRRSRQHDRHGLARHRRSACAQCHNHKYDPFSQKDYFRLLAFFANADYESRTFGDGTRYFEPGSISRRPSRSRRAKELQAEIDRLDQELKTATPALREAQEQWEQSMRAGGARLDAARRHAQPPPPTASR